MIDFLAALLALVLLFPLIAVVAFLLFLNNKGTPFFKQQRPGKHEQVFTLVKFKTMTDAKDEQGDLLPDELRLTTLGKVIRKTSLDELPQLWNVLKGEMSLIGPRPLLVEYLELYSDEQKKRHQVRPGITGWAQVNGRNAITWEKKFELDVWYVKHLSFLLDIKIVLLTIRNIIKASDITDEGGVSMTKFKGNNE